MATSLAPVAAARWPTKGLFVIALLFLLQQAQTVLLPVVVAVTLTFVLAPAVRRLRRRGVAEPVGAAVVVVTLLTAIGLALTALSGPAVAWWDRAPNDLQQLMQSLERLRAAVPLLAPPAAASPPVARPSARGAAPAPPADPLKEKITSEGLTFTGVVLKRFAGFAIATAATVILLYFLLASERWLMARALEAIPRRRARALVLGGLRAAQREIGRYLATQGMINIGLAVAVGIAMWAVGLANPVLWGAVAGTLNFIPYLGPLLVTLILGMVGVLSFDTLGQMLAPPLAYLAINAVESNFISPWVIGRRLEMSPLAVFLAVLLWGWLWGVAGALIAVPALLGMRIVCRRVRALRVWCVFLDRGRREPPSLRALLRVPRRAV